ncbi:hypothetical protein BASA81_004592 [Batrachochytrium salamandrivorans]|nr:hypothetical protein BASA81_004592 [Batrachochytrium salamandrivorans]
MTAAAAVLVDGEAKICSNGPTREHYIRQFDISRVGDTICKACKDVQAYDGGHLLDTLTSAVDYVERHQGNSIYEQDEDAAHMGPEITATTDMAIAAPAATAKQIFTAFRSKKEASIKQGDSSTAPISHSVIGSEKENASLLTGKRTRKDGVVPTQQKKARKVDTQPVVEKLVILEGQLEVKEEEGTSRYDRLLLCDNPIAPARSLPTHWLLLAIRC